MTISNASQSARRSESHRSDDGRSLRYAARIIGAPYTTVQEAVKLFRETQSYSRRPGSGRKRVTSGRDDRYLVSQVLRDRHTTTVEAPYGPIKDKNDWRICTNSELTQLYKKPNIFTLIKAKRIELIGHVSRMNGGRSIKKIFEGKPRLRRTDCVERDLCSLGVRNWRRKAENRNEWAIIIKEALAKLIGFETLAFVTLAD
ncbi:hypothetical protein C0J52_11101 [Blattella germanica]|nr:hypothetical protein C0J52_11101 [Blattella germanica]